MFRRFRQNRVDQATRLAHRETRLTRADLILPVFLLAGNDRQESVESMPGIYRCSIDRAIPWLEPLVRLGLRAVLLFGVPDRKGLDQAWAVDGIVQQAVPALAAAFPSLEITSDVCLCSYSEDGQCHVGDNDETCRILTRVAVSHAAAGVTAVAPSDMMDGRVFHIRRALEEAGQGDVPVYSYAAKFASGFYGPFREAAASALSSGDRKTHQLDPPNAAEALAEIDADVEEGAAQVIVKPALAYLDIVHRASRAAGVPVIAYNVSGEYAMLRHLIDGGLADETVIWETLVSLKRAGASRIISYHTPQVLEELDEWQSA